MPNSNEIKDLRLCLFIKRKVTINTVISIPLGGFTIVEKHSKNPIKKGIILDFILEIENKRNPVIDELQNEAILL